MISAKLGHFLDKPLAPIARQISIHPNFLSISGFVITIFAAFIIPLNSVEGGLIILIGGTFDIFDGIVARAHGKDTKFGALLDSTLDRYADAALFLSVAWLLFKQNNMAGVAVTFGGLVGSFLISYVRARAEGLGIDCQVGLIERPERIVLLAIGCLSGYFFPIMIVIFILSHITVAQRVAYVYRKTGCY